MATMNRPAPPLPTHEGAPSVSINPLQQLERCVLSCLLWEKEFYEDGVAIAERIATLCQQVAPEHVAALACKAKQEMKIRHTPLLLVRELVRTVAGRKLFGSVAPQVFLRPDDLTEFLSLYWKDNPQEPLPKQVKRHLGAAFRRFDEYQLAKWNGGNKAIKLRDVMRLTRPKPVDEAQAALWGRLVKGELATPDTWEVELSKGTDKKEAWTRLLLENRLGGLALLRNLRNMREAGVDMGHIKLGIDRLTVGRLLPMNFLSAAKHNPALEPDLEAKFLACFTSRPKLLGATVILLDVSGSMNCPLSGRSELNRLDVACSLGMIGRELCPEARVFTFSNVLAEVPARRGFALRDAILHSQPRGGTHLGGALAALQKFTTWQRLIVITDEQSQDPVPQMKGTLINVASAKNGVGYRQWTHIDGWSDKVFDYLAAAEGHAVLSEEEG